MWNNLIFKYVFIKNKGIYLSIINFGKDLTLKDREWTCQVCGSQHDRDINDAINIRNFGLRNQPSVTQSEWLHCACGVETHQSLADV